MGPRIAAEFTAHQIAIDADGSQVEALLPPELDGEAERLADLAGITPHQAEAALEWMRREESNEVFRAAGILVSRIVALIVPPDPAKIDPHLIGLRFLGLASLLGKVGTLSEIAKRADVSRQLLHFHGQKIADGIGFHGFAQKQAATREVFSEAMKASWSRLSPEQRHHRRMGKAALMENAATFDDQNLTSDESL